MAYSFDDLIPSILKTEGGYVADDNGHGASNFGINEAANPDVDVKNLTKEKAEKIYEQRYWNPIKAHLPEGASKEYAQQALDAAVNMGPGTAISLIKNSPDLESLKQNRAQKYRDIIKAHPSDMKYAKSWGNRVGVELFPEGNKEGNTEKKPNKELDTSWLTDGVDDLFKVDKPEAEDDMEQDVKDTLKSTSMIMLNNASHEKQAFQFTINNIPKYHTPTSLDTPIDPDYKDIPDVFAPKVGAVSLEDQIDDLKKEYGDEKGFGRRFGAAYRSSLMGMDDDIYRLTNPFPAKPGFDWEKYTDENNYNLTYVSPDVAEDLKYSRSPAEYQYVYNNNEYKMEQDKIATSGGKWSTMAIYMGAGLLNPEDAALMALGGGVVDAVRIGGIGLEASVRGAKVAEDASRAAKIMAKFKNIGVHAGEDGVVAVGPTTTMGSLSANLARGLGSSTGLTISQIAQGDQVHVSDVINNILIGTVAGSSLHYLSGAAGKEATENMNKAVESAVKFSREAAEKSKSDLLHNAVKDLGPNASPEDINAHMSLGEQAIFEKHLKHHLSEVPGADKIFNEDDVDLITRLQDIDRKAADWANTRRRAKQAKNDEVVEASLNQGEMKSDGNMKPSEIQNREQTYHEIRETHKSIYNYNFPDDLSVEPKYSGKTVHFSNDYDKAAYILSKGEKGTIKSVRESLLKSGLSPKDAKDYGEFIQKNLSHVFGRRLKPEKGFDVSSLLTTTDRDRFAIKSIVENRLGKESVKLPEVKNERLYAKHRLIKINPSAKIKEAMGNLTSKGEPVDFGNDFDNLSYLLSEAKNNAPKDIKKAARKYVKNHKSLDISDMEARGRELVDALKAKEAPEASPKALEDTPENIRVRGRDKEQEALREAYRASEGEKAAKEAADDKIYGNMDLTELAKYLGVKNPNLMTLPGFEGTVQAAKFQAMNDMAQAKLNAMNGFESVSELTKKLNRRFNKVKLGRLNPIVNTLLDPESPPIFRLFAAKVLENPTGALGGRTVGLTKYIMNEHFTWRAELKYIKAKERYFHDIGKSSTVQTLFDTKEGRAFDRAHFEYREMKRRNPDSVVNHPWHKYFEDYDNALDESHGMMSVAQKVSKTVGYESLPESSVGYQTWLARPDKIAELSPEGKLEFAKVMANEIAKSNPEINAGEAQAIAKAYVDRLNQKIVGNQYAAINIFSKRGQSDMIAAMEKSVKDGKLDKEMFDTLRAKFQKGAQNYTKGRVERDLYASFIDPVTKKEYRLMDMMEHNSIKILHSQSNRISGEVALTRFGVNGRDQFNELMEAGRAYGASKAQMEAMHQAGAEIFGDIIGNADPNSTATLLQSAMRILYLGGLVFAQAMETGNMIGAVGLGGTLKGITMFRRMSKQAKKLARGEEIDDKVMEGLDEMIGPLGARSYKSLLPVGETGREVSSDYSLSDMNVIHRIANFAEHAQQRMTFFSWLHAGQQRAAGQLVLAKAAKFISEGRNDIALRQMGITDDIVNRLRKEKGLFVFNKRGKLVEFNPNEAVDTEAVAQMAQAIRRGVGQIFQETFAGERGTWIQSDMWKTMMGLRSYSVTSINKQFVRTFHNYGAARAIGLTLGQMALAIPVLYFRTILYSVGMSDEQKEKYYARMLTPLTLFSQSLMYSSILGASADVYQFAMNSAGFEVGGTKLTSDSSVGSIIPAIGTADDLMQALGTVQQNLVGEVDKKTGERKYRKSWRPVKRIIPGAGMWQSRILLNYLNQE